MTQLKEGWWYSLPHILGHVAHWPSAVTVDGETENFITICGHHVNGQREWATPAPAKMQRCSLCQIRLDAEKEKA